MMKKKILMAMFLAGLFCFILFLYPQKEAGFTLNTLNERISENRPLKCLIYTEGDCFWLITDPEDIEKVIEIINSKIKSVYIPSKGDQLSYLGGAVLSVVGENPQNIITIYADFQYMECGMTCEITNAETAEHLETLTYNTGEPLWEDVKRIAKAYLKRNQPIKDLDVLIKQQLCNNLK